MRHSLSCPAKTKRFQIKPKRKLERNPYGIGRIARRWVGVVEEPLKAGQDVPRGVLPGELIDGLLVRLGVADEEEDSRRERIVPYKRNKN